MNITGIKSKSSVKNYWDYFVASFLFYKVQKFDYSVKVQIFNPVKNYIIDTLLAQQVGFTFSDNQGRLLENMVFMQLRSQGREIFYHLKEKECDFVVKEKKICLAIQVCFELTAENTAREIDGLVEAMRSYNLSEGFVVTFYEEKELQVDNFKIHIVPVWKWLLDEKMF